ncbi:mitochondrial enolase superfamily member 1 [Grus japonensis]|uniref:Mitochondrial enolase superfamily member 1 n=1 Tax=Grus japonensis TaxID=30415 RepID=A0ABC9WH47_GRUJA
MENGNVKSQFLEAGGILDNIMEKEIQVTYKRDLYAAESIIKAFYNEMTGLVDEKRAMDMVCLHFSKAFDTICHDILIDKLMKCGLEK